MARKINYFARNFADVRTELINFVRQYYPDIFSDFNDASVGMMLLELNAAVSDMLSSHTDRMFQETQIDYAQEKRSVLAMARTMGLKIPGKRPSITIVDFSFVVPVKGDTFDISYCPIIRRGAQVSGGGKVFETVDDIDFSSPFTTGGLPNRLILPNIDSNGTIVNYTLTKREIVINGTSKVFKKVLTIQDVKPFLEVILPDDDVLSIDSIITLSGTNFNGEPSIDDFLNFDNRWFEVDALAENKIFIEDRTKVSDNSGTKPGKWEKITKKFIREYTDKGFTKIIFGAGSQDIGSLCEYITPTFVERIGDFINNMALGEVPAANNTLFVKYRVGGGSASNVGPNVLTSIGLIDIRVNGVNPQINQAVRKSLTVNNPIPALGGKDSPSVEEIRNMVRYNFSSQNRCVTVKDYQNRISMMPGEFGVPFRVGVWEEKNKINISILGLDDSGKLTNSSTNTLKANIADYLSDFRMINDYVSITNGQIVNLGFEVDLFIDKQYSQSEIITAVIAKINDYMDINKHFMGENIYLAQLIENINNVAGVLNVIDLRVFNKVGSGQYSLNEITQPYSDDITREIDLLGEYTLFGVPNAMFEVKYPEKDIKIRVKG